MTRTPIPATITSGFWRERLDTNASAALDHQWRQLEASGCIDNFRTAGGEKKGFREGFFFADSDAYKWLDAAARSLAHHPDPALQARMDELIDLLARAQAPDGYLYTYNQIHFPRSRWENLQVEHEFYCLGHLIEAGIAHVGIDPDSHLLGIARRAADLLVREFLHASPLQTDGHEEIEIALLRLYALTNEPSYQELACQMLERRGHIRAYPLVFARQSARTVARMQARDRMRKQYQREHPEHKSVHFASRALRRVPPLTQLRLLASLLSGKYNQQNAGIQSQNTPVGHAVRFTYLQTAAAMQARMAGDAQQLAVCAQAWERMVTRRMYVTGGLGALPLIEGFGQDYELPPESAYAETCAAIGSLLWNWEMLLASGSARYADLFEWQLYNATSPSMAVDGCSYFYDNPLADQVGLQRAAWYDVPCCPSNLSRTWASLGSHLLTQDERGVWLQQYIAARVDGHDAKLEIDSDLPWQGSVRVRIRHLNKLLHLRIPAWAGEYRLKLNGEDLAAQADPHPTVAATACGYDPRRSFYVHVPKNLEPGDLLELELEMPIRIYPQDARIRGCGGQAAFGRGPLVYCLEAIDNPGMHIFSLSIHPSSLKPRNFPGLLDGCVALHGKTSSGDAVQLIPFLLRANRGAAAMTVFAKTEGAYP